MARVMAKKSHLSGGYCREQGTGHEENPGMIYACHHSKWDDRHHKDQACSKKIGERVFLLQACLPNLFQEFDRKLLVWFRLGSRSDCGHSGLLCLFLQNLVWWKEPTVL